MGEKYIVLGGNAFKNKSVSKKMSQSQALSVINLDRVIESGSAEDVIELTKDAKWLIQTKYNRILRLRGQDADCIVFVDYPLWRNLFDAIIHLHFGEVREMIYYHKVRRPWAIDKLEEYGVEKQVTILNNRRQMKRFITDVNK